MIVRCDWKRLDDRRRQAQEGTCGARARLKFKSEFEVTAQAPIIFPFAEQRNVTVNFILQSEQALLGRITHRP